MRCVPVVLDHLVNRIKELNPNYEIDEKYSTTLVYDITLFKKLVSAVDDIRNSSDDILSMYRLISKCNSYDLFFRYELEDILYKSYSKEEINLHLQYIESGLI